VRNDARPHRQSKFRRGFFSDDRGAVAIIMGLVLPVIIGMVGLAVEVGSWFGERRSLQSAADAAALAGAWDLLSGSNDTVTTSATTYATRNGFSTSSGTITVNTPPNSGSYTTDTTAVEVILTRTQSLLFSALFLGSNITISARAVANSGAQALGCLIALDSSASSALHMDSNAEVNLDGCGITVNSSDSEAFTLDSNAVATADFVRVTGNYDTAGNSSIDADSITTGAAATADPYADIAMPAVGSCDETNYQLGTNDSATLNPGVYCGGFSMRSNSSATLNPGTYIINGGTFSMDSNTTLSGNGVTIVLTGSGSDYATININSNAEIDLVAPSSGDYAGIAIMQDRDAPSTATNTLDSNVVLEVSGSLYFPNNRLRLRSNARITSDSVDGCALVIADTVELDSNSSIDINNSEAACSSLSVPTSTSSRPVLVE